MKIHREDHHSVTVLKPQGEIGRAEAAQMWRCLEALIEEKRYQVVLDLEDVKFIGSPTIMMLLRMNREFLGHGGKIILLRPQNGVKRFLSIGRVLELFDRYETKVEAVQSFANRERGMPEEAALQPVDTLHDVACKQKQVLLRLIGILQRKGFLDMERFNSDMNRSAQLVFQIFRKELGKEFSSRTSLDS
ncbi:MAG TPA: STAS domain-containing protein [bacterium]|nr:STAS domain-containing protein [Candidatus Omnitrophota bacterium]HOL93199.1 STAS domain-containing protein [bacterium]